MTLDLPNPPINFSPLRILSEADIKNLHAESLQLLAHQGIKVMHTACRSMLADHGCKLETGSEIMKIPADLVTQALQTTPKRVLLGGREPVHDLTLEMGRLPVTRNGGGPGHLLDMHTNQVQGVTTNDLESFTRVVDACEHIDYAAPVYAQDTPAPTRDLHTLATVFKNTSKHVNMRVLSLRSLPYVIQMAQIVAGGKQALKDRPVISMLESPIAPLKIPDVLVETLDVCGEYGIPVELCSMPNLGVTGPITLAGSLLLSNVEMLAAIVISQLYHPGAPLQFSPRLVMMDMKTGMTLIGSIECALLSMAGIQLAREAYAIPVNMHGPLTDSPIVDDQSAIERTYFTFLSAYAGASVLAGAGHVEQNLIVSLPQLVMDDEIYGLVRHSLQGLTVNADTLGIDAIQRCMAQENFLTDEHTLKHLRVERFHPALLLHTSRAAWEEAGAKDMYERAKDRVEHIINSHQPKPLDETQVKLIEEVIQEAESDSDQTR